MEKDEKGNLILSIDDVKNIKSTLICLGILYVTGCLIHSLVPPRSFYGWIKVKNEH